MTTPNTDTARVIVRCSISTSITFTIDLDFTIDFYHSILTMLVFSSTIIIVQQ